MTEQTDGATPLEYDEIKGLIPTHITTKEELNALEFQNIAGAHAWMQSVKACHILNPGFICLFHKKMFGDVWRWAGKYRKTEKNIGTRHFEIQVEVHKLCEEANGWLEYTPYQPDEFAARFHHRLVYIHPFSNGNGRLSRFMADLILEKIFKKESFSWGRNSLIKQGDTRARYIKALKRADDHDFSLLLKFVRS